MDLRSALGHVVHGGALTREQSRAVFGAALTEHTDPAALGGLLCALAQRGEKAAEVAGAVDVLRGRMTVFDDVGPDAVDTCGTGGDGLGTFNLSTAAAFVAAGAGARVIKHGNRAVSSRSGSADVLEALGGQVDTSPATARRALDASGFTFLFAPRYHPAMRFAAPVRRALGIPTLFNLVGPLCNPARVERQVIGVASADRVQLFADVLGALGTRRAFVVHGAGGADEVTLAGPNQVQGVGDAPEVDGAARPFGMHFAPVSALAGGDAHENARTMVRLLGGGRDPALAPLVDATLLNAALALIAAGLAEELEEGVARAREGLESGRALTVLERWVAATQKEVAA